MRILLVNHFPLEGSGSGVVTRNLARELVLAGHKVLVIAPDHAPCTGQPFEVRTIICDPGDGRTADLPFNFPCFTTHPQSPVTFHGLTDDQIDLYATVYWRFIEKALRDFMPDLIHVQHLWVAAACVADSGLPYVATVHGTDLMGYEQDERYHEMAERGMLCARRIVGISRRIAEKTRRLFPQAADRITVIHNGFDSGIFKPRPEVTRTGVLAEFGLPETRHLVCFVGKLADFKGVDTLIHAAALYERELGSVTTLIIGMGTLRGELERQAAANGLHNLHFIDYQPTPALIRAFSGADLAVFPSREEPFGLVAIEALACGTPVVTTNQGAFPEYVTPEVGTMVDINAPDQLAAAIISELRADAKRTKGPAAAEYAAREFAWSRKIREYIDLYQRALRE
ncbi:MAG: glycosyltransferase family 4 protein [Planctomycetota bacterium]